MLSSFVFIVLCFTIFNVGGQTEDVCVTVRSGPQPETVPGRPGKRGPVGFVGPKGDTGPEGTCTCNLTEIAALLNQELSILQERLAQQENLTTALNSTIFRLSPCINGRSELEADPGWYTPGNCYQYKLSSSTQTWEESKRICQDQGGDLASAGMRIATDKRAIIDEVVGTKQTWIGLSDLETEGTFVWNDGIRANIRDIFWDPGEPNGRTAENCVEVNFPNDLRYAFNDDRCNKNNYALCEKTLAL